MKRFFFIFLAIIVIATTAFYVYRSIQIPEISYTQDYQTIDDSGTFISVSRVYTAGVDFEGFQEEVSDSLVSAEFTEDDIYSAAGVNGTPVFLPTFTANATVTDASNNLMEFSSGFYYNTPTNITDIPFEIANVHVEIETVGFAIEDFKPNIHDENVDYKAPVVLSQNKDVLAVNLTNVSDFTAYMTGLNGRVTIRYVYDVISQGIIKTTVSSQQYLEIFADISYTAADGLKVTYTREPYTSLDALYGVE